jgi:flagellar biosynthesis protein FliQ
MTEAMVIQLFRDALMITIVVSGPIIGAGLVAGLLVSILQTTTSIQEQTLSFVPKVLAMSVAMIFFGHWMMRMLVDYTTSLFMMLPSLVR